MRAVGSPNSRGIGGVPMSIEILIRSRIDKLPVGARRLLQCASVLGMRSPAVSLRGVAGMDPGAFESALWDLVRERFVVADAGLSVEFVHQITQLACYEGIPRGQRAKLHQSVLEAAENDQHHLTLPFEALADHAYRAGRLETALDHLWEACRESIARSAVRSVAELRRRALSICSELGEPAALRAVDFDLLCFDAMQQLGAYLELVGPAREVPRALRRRSGRRDASARPAATWRRPTGCLGGTSPPTLWRARPCRPRCKRETCRWPATLSSSSGASSSSAGTSRMPSSWNAT